MGTLNRIRWLRVCPLEMCVCERFFLVSLSLLEYIKSHTEAKANKLILYFTFSLRVCLSLHLCSIAGSPELHPFERRSKISCAVRLSPTHTNVRFSSIIHTFYFIRWWHLTFEFERVHVFPSFFFTTERGEYASTNTHSVTHSLVRTQRGKRATERYITDRCLVCE